SSQEPDDVQKPFQSQESQHWIDRTPSHDKMPGRIIRGTEWGGSGSVDGITSPVFLSHRNRGTEPVIVIPNRSDSRPHEPPAQVALTSSPPSATPPAQPSAPSAPKRLSLADLQEAARRRRGATA